MSMSLAAMRTDVSFADVPPGITFESAVLFPWPDDVQAWLLSRFGAGVRIVAADDGATDLGWPVTIFDLSVAGEARALALYKFLEWGGAVEVRGIRDEAGATAVLDALRTARPDFSGDEAICVADLLPGEGR